MKKTKIFALALLVICAFGNVANAENVENSCRESALNEDELMDRWFEIVADDRNVRLYLNYIKPCVEADVSFQKRVDALAMSFLAGLMDKLQTNEERFKLVELTQGVILLSASEGLPLAQEHVAWTYNVGDSFEFSEFFPKNEEKFIYWTKKAAAQKQPNSMFNLAMRLGATDQVSPYLKRNYEVAYVLLKDIEDMSNSAMTEDYMYRQSFVLSYLKRIEDSLGIGKTAELEASRHKFDYQTLVELN